MVMHVDICDCCNTMTYRCGECGSDDMFFSKRFDGYRCQDYGTWDEGCK